MKFLNKRTKVILETNSAFVIEQLKNNSDYEEVQEVKKEEVKPILKNKKTNKD